VAGITSEWWASVRNGGRFQIGIPAGITSEYLAGMRRNLHEYLHFRRIRPSGWTDEQFHAYQRDRDKHQDAARKREKQRVEGRMTRAQYLAQAEQKRLERAQLRIGRSTQWRREKKALAVAAGAAIWEGG
jgi:hypothetical protein